MQYIRGRERPVWEQFTAHLLQVNLKKMWKLLLALLVILSVTCLTAVGESEEAGSRDEDDVVRRRISGVLLFANVDYTGNRCNTDIWGIALCAWFLWERVTHSRIEGEVVLHLPDSVIGRNEVTIFRSKNEWFAVNEPLFFTHEFDTPASASMGQEITIECNLDDEHGTICEGKKSYRVDIPQNNYLDASIPTGTNHEIIAETLQRLGFEKLYRPDGYITIADVLHKLFNLDDVVISELPQILRDMRGVYLINAVLEEVSDDVTRPGTYKKIDDEWTVNPSRSSAKLYGQLYILPQSEIIPLSDVLPSTVELPNWATYITLPRIRGPAFPLFDLTRVERSRNDYRVYQDLYNRFNIYYKNPEVHSYVVFSNLRGVGVLGGDVTLYSDYCLARGYTFGFDTVTLSSDKSATLGQGLDNPFLQVPQYDVSIVQRGEVETENTTVLTGVFEFWAEDEHGNTIEPYGYFDIIYNGQSHRVWDQPDPTGLELPEEEIFFTVSVFLSRQPS